MREGLIGAKPIAKGIIRKEKLMDEHSKGSKELFKEVIDTGLCTFCGGCAGGCPYLVPYKGGMRLMDNCMLAEGQCYQYCPRTYTDMDAISQEVFGVPYGEDEIGAVKDVFLARSTDREIQKKAQDGGTVTTLLSLALTEGIIDAVVETKMDDDKIPRGFMARKKEELLACTGVSYEPSPVLEAINRLPRESTEKLGIVGVPCQVACVAKMKTYPPKNRVNIDNVKLLIGLFCGWTLANGFHQFLKEHFDLSQATKFDVPHHPGHTFDVYTQSDKKSVEIDEVRQHINAACNYCWDMTSEFADISAGSGRAMFRGWNTVIVRTKLGAELMDIAKRKHALETQPIPIESVDNLKRASLNKKKRAVSSIVGKTGDKKDLLYLGLSQNLVDKLLD